MRDVIGRFAGTSLAGHDLAVPDDLAGLTLLAFAYRQHQQSDVNSWLRLVAGDDRVRTIEVPVMGRRWLPGQRLINGGMASHMDQATREQTMCMYVDVAAFKRDNLGVSSDDVLAVLVDADGHVLWHAEGRAGPDTMSTLLAAIDGAAQAPAT